MKTAHIAPQAIPIPTKQQRGAPTKLRHKTQRLIKPAKAAKATIKPNPPNTPAPDNPADVAWQRMIAVLDAGLVKLFSTQERLQFAYLNEGTTSAADEPPTTQGTCHAPAPATLLEEQQIALEMVTKPWAGAVIQHVVINAGEDESTMLKQKKQPKSKPKKGS